MKRIALIILLSFGVMSLSFSQENKNTGIKMKQGKDIYLTFKLSDKVNMEPVFLKR